MASASTPSPDRGTLLASFRAGLLARKAGYAAEIAGLDEAAARETKSSAGDKYETAREMIAQTRRLAERNLAEVEAGLGALARMEAAPPGGRVGYGSLVETSLGWYLVGASLGEAESGGVAVRTLSLASPLGRVLKGKAPGESAPWKGGTLAILRLAP